MNFGNARTQPQNIDSFADQLKNALLAVGKGQNGRAIGIELGNKANFSQDVEKLVSEIKSSYKNYSSQMTKFSQVKELNRKLAGNFKNNLQVMVDVSRLLSSYVELFDVLKVEMKKMSTLVGTNMDLGNLSYLQDITTDRISGLNVQLKEQASKLQNLYSNYGMTEESKNLGSIISDVPLIAADATSISQNGGKARKGGRRVSRKPKQSQQ